MANLFFADLIFMTGAFVARPLILLAVLLVPDVLWLCLAEDRMHAFQYGLALTLCMFFGVFAWTQRRLGVLLLLGLPFALLVPFESYYIWRYASPSSAHVLAVIGETNFVEASEYLGYAKGLLLLGSGVAIGIAFFCEFRRIAFRQFCRPHRMWRLLGAGMLIPFASMALAELSLESEVVPEASNARGEQSVSTLSLLKDVTFGMDKVVTPSFPLGVPFRLGTYFAEQKRLDAARESFKKININAQTARENSSELVVLVIGESANPKHWHANGYARQTTPEIEKIGAAASLSDLLTAWPTTRLSVPSLLTGVLDEQGLPPMSVPSVLDVFRAAGWETHWLSNQSPLGMHDSTIVLHAERAEYRHFLNAADYTQSAEHDGHVVPALEKVLLSRPEKRKLVVIHLLGSHADYSNRYPAEFSVFSGSDGLDNKIGGFSPIHNEYDNSVLYTDFVLAKIISRLDSLKQAVSLVYVSDHGENLPDLGCTKYGHGHSTVDNYRTAGLVWTSPKLEKNLPGLAERIQVRKNQPLHLLDVFHSLIDVAGIDYAGLDPARSWFGQAWHYHPRPVWSIPNFDQVTPLGACRVIEKSVR
ncbi:phosphoethanolamine transferase [Dechloromonas sp. ZY10]|uniref:phosphoethanolamine transferase n=1 Tax=Dechloromonas aquae TaxID=2664436 RepID=UPI003526DC13